MRAGLCTYRPTTQVWVARTHVYSSPNRHSSSGTPGRRCLGPSNELRCARSDMVPRDEALESRRRAGISLTATVSSPLNGGQGVLPVWGFPGTLGKPLGRSRAEAPPDSRDMGLTLPSWTGSLRLGWSSSLSLPASPGGRGSLGAEGRGQKRCVTDEEVCD